jgi:hypothetical protein
MDLNYLFHRHQVALSASTGAASPEARSAHRGLARGYAGRIATVRASAGGSDTPTAARVS